MLSSRPKRKPATSMKRKPVAKATRKPAAKRRAAKLKRRKALRAIDPPYEVALPDRVSSRTLFELTEDEQTILKLAGEELSHHESWALAQRVQFGTTFGKE